MTDFKETITTRCIICHGEAKVFTGHVLKDSQPITAGWCREHLEKSEDINLMSGPACFGQWKPEYGYKEILSDIHDGPRQRGGLRPNAGRKTIDDKKRITKNVRYNPDLIEEINQKYIGEGKAFTTETEFFNEAAKQFLTKLNKRKLPF